MPYPLAFLRIRQQFSRPRVDNIPAAIRASLDKLSLGKTIKPGQTVALTAGSRGIASIPVILKSVVQHLKDLGINLSLVQAMGSHGGGTAEGQREIIESYGITEAFVGAPIEASMDVVSLGTTAEGFPVVIDRIASQADHIGVVARVKPHTSYHGPLESGLCR
ncbi:MAG: lactate racemase domain-containing protein [Gemmataceae bacterium]